MNAVIMVSDGQERSSGKMASSAPPLSHKGEKDGDLIKNVYQDGEFTPPPCAQKGEGRRPQ